MESKIYMPILKHCKKFSKLKIQKYPIEQQQLIHPKYFLSQKIQVTMPNLKEIELKNKYSPFFYLHHLK